MDFPITELFDREESINWIVEHFHQGKLSCPRCAASVNEAREFRTTKKSQLTVYRCIHCQQTYNLYSNTVFEQRHIPPEKVILLLRGVLKGEPALVLARELELHYTTVLEVRRDLQDNACFSSRIRHWKMNRLRRMKCFRTRGKKGDEHFDRDDPPRRRANKRRGRGTYANDRPPIVGTVGRETGQVRMRA